MNVSILGLLCVSLFLPLVLTLVDALFLMGCWLGDELLFATTIEYIKQEVTNSSQSDGWEFLHTSVAAPRRKLR